MIGVKPFMYVLHALNMPSVERTGSKGSCRVLTKIISRKILGLEKLGRTKLTKRILTCM
jgi:hypothetical protein